MADPVTIIALVVAVASAVYTATQTPPDQSNDDVGANIVKQGSASPRNVVYGRCRVSSTKIFSNVQNTNSEQLLQIFMIGGIGKLTAIHQCWIEDKQVLNGSVNLTTDPTLEYQGFCSNVDELVTLNDPSPDPAKWPIFSRLSGEFGNLTSLQFRNGSLNERASELAIRYGDGEWTTDHRGDLVPHVVVRTERSIERDGVVITSPQYKIQCEVSGIEVLDPRDNVRKFTSNVAICLMDYLTSGSVITDRERYYGMAIPIEYIDVDSFIAAANFCESNNLEINAEIQGDQNYGEILNKFLSCFDGILTIENGKITCKFEQAELPVQSFDEDNIVGNFGYTNQSSGNYFNAVSVTYKSFVNDEEQDEYVLPANFNTDSRIQSDGFIKRKTVEMPFTVDGRTVRSDGTANVNGAVKWRANRELRKSLFQKEVTFDVDLIENPVSVYDVIRVSHPEYLIENKLFRVKTMKKSIDGDKLNVATITASEYDISVYGGNDDGIGTKPKPPVTPISKPTSLNVDVTTFISSGYGTLSWQCLYRSQHRLFDIEYKLSSSSDWVRLGTTESLFFKIANLRSDDYDFRVRTRDPYRGSTDWTELLNQEIGVDYILPTVTNVSVNASGRDFHFKWDDMTTATYTVAGAVNGPDSPSNGLVNDIFSHYRVDISHFETGSWVLKDQYVITDPEFIYTYLENQTNNLNRRVRANVYIVVKDSSVSQLGEGTVDAQNSQITTQPSGVNVVSNVAQIWLDWLPNTSQDFAGTLIHFSDTSGFVPDSSNVQSDLNGTFFNWVWPAGTNDVDPPPSKYIRIGHYDAFGKDGITYGPELVATYRSINNELDPFDDTELRERLAENERLVSELDDGISKYIPNVSDSIASLRNADNAPVDPSNNAVITERINLVASTDKSKTAGFALVAKNGQRSKMVIAADDFVIGGGKGSTPSNDTRMLYWDSTQGRAFIENASIVNLTSSNIQARSITAQSIATGTITANEIGTNAITANKIQAGAINSAKLESNSVTTNKIAAGAVVASKIQAGSITTDKIASNSITSSKIQASAITGDKISATTTITAGTGDNVAAMSGSGTYRFWAGHSSASSAPFRVSNTGQVQIRSSTSSSTSRLEFESDRLSVYEGSQLRVRIGRL